MTNHAAYAGGAISLGENLTYFLPHIDERRKDAGREEGVVQKRRRMV